MSRRSKSPSSASSGKYVCVLCHGPKKQRQMYISKSTFWSTLQYFIIMLIDCFLFLMYPQPMALQAVSFPHLDLESLQAPLQPVQLASEDDR